MAACGVYKRGSLDGRPTPTPHTLTRSNMSARSSHHVLHTIVFARDAVKCLVYGDSVINIAVTLA